MKTLRDRALDHPFRLVVGWFVLLAAALAFATLSSGTFRAVVESPPPVTDVFGSFRSAMPATAEGDASVTAVVVTGALALLSLVGALLFAIPVAWIYTATRRQEGYETSFVRMLVGLPVVVAGVVRIVSGDLALAFALAGIVAAVRFRTTVRDLQNAVYAFAVIGIGLAAGRGSFMTAIALSSVFCFVGWAVWRFEVGKAGPGLRHATGNIALADALVPGETHSAVTMGDRSLVAGLTAQHVPNFEDVTDRLAYYVEADALRSKRKYDTLLIAYTNDPVAAVEHASDVLEQDTLRYVHVGDFDVRLPGTEPGAQPPLRAVGLLMRLEERVDVWTMMDQLECGRDDCVVRAAQLKPIKGLRKWLT